MRRGTTPTITLIVDADITSYSVYVTFQKGAKTITLENERLTMSYANGVTTIALTLTQAETLQLTAGVCDVQIRAIKDGTAIATDIKQIDVGKILLEGAISE